MKRRTSPARVAAVAVRAVVVAAADMAAVGAAAVVAAAGKRAFTTNACKGPVRRAFCFFGESVSMRTS
jgi:hypothetical protein